ncbi:MAG: biopolymer transporter ExbD [Desulfobacterales bacterium]|nr:MAG: biopolymer transporter ExbD [Desulfobacterales bacterium]
MIDMVFILLMFFIVSTSFIREAGVVVERPAASTAESQNAQVVVAIDAGNIIWVEGSSTDVTRLGLRLTHLKAEKPDLGIIVAADKNCNAGTLVRVIDTCREVGITNVSVATKEK